MGGFTAVDQDYEARIRDSFARQAIMRLPGASLVRVEPGHVEIELPFRDDLTQQHGFLHAGVVTAVVDSACGYAALSLMEPGAGVVSAEFKINLLAPAVGERFLAAARVVKAGRTLTVCGGELTNGSTVVAVMQATMMAVRDRAGMTD